MFRYSQYANKSDGVFRDIKRFIKEVKTPYQECVFFESEVNGVCIAINGDIQSCEADEFIYHEALVHIAMLYHKNPKNVLIMGGGEGATAREVLKHSKVLDKVVMVDIDKDFVEACKETIPSWSEGVWEHKKFEIIYDDINNYLANTDIKFDVVIGDLVDVDDWDSFLANLYSDNFYTKLKNVLNDDAIIATQAGSLSTKVSINHDNIRKSLKAVFKNVTSYGVVVPSFYSLWGYVLASDSKIDTSYEFFKNEILKRIDERNLKLKGLGKDELYGVFLIPKGIKQSYA